MRVKSIDFFKIIFTFLVVFAHMDISYPGNNVAVDFFFVFTGFFLAKKFYDQSWQKGDNAVNQFQYTARRVKVLYPQYIFSLLVLFVYMFGKEVWQIASHSASAGTLGDLAAKLYEIVPNALMIQDMGFFAQSINAASWYVSVMLIAGYFIYGFMCRDEKFYTELAFPIAFILIGTFLKYGREPFGIVGPFYIAMMRGVFAMLEGVIICKIMRSGFYTKFKAHSLIFNLSGLAAIAALFACGRYNNQHIIMFAFMVMYLYCPDSWINKVIKGKIFNRAGDWAYAVYLNHAFVIMLLEDIFCAYGVVMPREKFAWIAAAASAVYSVFTVILLDKIKAACKNKAL